MNPIALLHAIAAVVPVDSLSLFSEQAAAAAVSALWQGALLVCFLALSIRFFPGVSAAHRFRLWAAAFIVLAGLPLLASVPAAFATTSVAGPAPLEGARPLFSPMLSLDERWSFAIAALWALASLVRAADLAVHSVRLRALWKSARPVELAPRLSSMLLAALSDCGRGPVEVCTTTDLQRPCVIGFLKPRILIPDWLFTRLTAGELEQIALHEAEHLRRRDDWSNLFQKLCLVLFPLNLSLMWIERRLCREREMACDEGVLRITQAPRAYAACLASLAERGLDRRAEALSLGAWQRRPELVDRVHSILRGKSELGLAGTRLLVGAMTCGLAIASVAMARCPQLVAFVPESSAHASTLAALPMPSRVSKSRLTNADCVGACAPADAASAGAKILRSSPAATTASHSSVASATAQEGQPRAVMAKALIGDMSIGDMLFRDAQSSPAAPNEKEQQWIVMTTFEQVQTSGTNAQIVADYDIATAVDPQTSAQANATGGAINQAPARTAIRITTTRLVLKIFPASSIPSQPGVAAMRDGWLFLQL